MEDIIPSHLYADDREPIYDGNVFNNVRLRIGEVQEAIYPDDRRNRSQKFIEYRVFTQHRANGTAVTKMYDYCTLINPFAGLADKATWTLRGANSATQGHNGLGRGSKVLLLCINGETASPVIIGGIRDQTDTSEEKDKAKSLGHHLDFVFNGISFNINDAGELTGTYNGKTKADGTPDDSVDTDKTGSTVSMGQDITIKTGDSNKDGKVTVQVAGSPKVTATQEGVQLGDGGEAIVLGNTLVNKMNQLFNQLQTQLNILGGILALPPFPKPTAQPPITAMVSAINSFTADLNSALSKKNNTD